MSIFFDKNGKLVLVDEVEFKLESEIQNIIENNIKQLFGLEIVKSQFSIQNFRIDTLAFDSKTNSFVIIEYKKDKNFSVIDQGYAYLSLLLNNKSDFVLEYNANCKSSLKRNEADWTQSKVIFISPCFTSYQTQSINFKDLPIELWEIKKFVDGIVSLQQIKPLSTNESIKTIYRSNRMIEGVNKEIKVYTEEDHFSNVTGDIVEFYKKIKNLILGIGSNIKIKPQKHYIAFTTDKINFVDIHIQSNTLKAWLNLKIGQLDDAKKIARDVSKIGHWGNGDYELKINDEKDLDYIINLVGQSYKKNS